MIADHKKRHIYRWLSVPVSIGAIALVWLLNIPNPMMILIIPVVFFTYADGYVAGSLSGGTAVAYSAWFFFYYTQDAQASQKLFTIIAAVATIIVLVGKLQAQLLRYNRHLEEKLREQADRLNQSNNRLIDSLSTVVEFRNMESGQHIRRIRKYATILLEAMAEDYSLTPGQIESIANASAMHDIGKIVIPDHILLKPGPLTNEEFDNMKTHTVHGCELLDHVSVEEEDKNRYYHDICRHHHERWDGNGYPDGLKGDEITIWAQVVSLADVYDALTSDRVYKKAFSHEKAVDMIINSACGVFNPELLDRFLQLQEQFRRESGRQHNAPDEEG